MKTRSRPSSGRRSQQQQQQQQSPDRDIFSNSPKPPRSRPSSGRRSVLSHGETPSPDLMDEDGEDEEVDVLFDLNAKPSKQTSKISDSMDTLKVSFLIYLT